MCSFLWCVRPVVSCFSASFITICDSLQGTLRNINMQWEVCLLIAYGKEYALGKGCVLLSSLPTICRSHWELVSFYRRDSGFLTSCQHTTVSVHVLLIKWSSFAIHQHWSMSCFWGNAQHLSVIPVSYIMSKCDILSLCYAQCGEIINQHSWKLMRLSWKAPWRKANPAIIKTKNVEHSNRRVFFFFFSSSSSSSS